MHVKPNLSASSNLMLENSRMNILLEFVVWLHWHGTIIYFSKSKLQQLHLSVYRQEVNLHQINHDLSQARTSAAVNMKITLIHCQNK